MSLVFRVSVLNVENVIKRVVGVRSAFRSKAVWAEIFSFLRKVILVRTARGVDADEHKFADYHPGYKLFRQAFGRPTSKVDLFFSGTMLSSIDYDVTETGGRMYFLPTQAPAPQLPGGVKGEEPPPSPLKAYLLQVGTKKPRKFFAFSKRDVEEIVRKLLVRYDEKVGG